MTHFGQQLIEDVNCLESKVPGEVVDTGRSGGLHMKLDESREKVDSMARAYDYAVRETVLDLLL